MRQTRKAEQEMAPLFTKYTLECVVSRILKYGQPNRTSFTEDPQEIKSVKRSALAATACLVYVET